MRRSSLIAGTIVLFALGLTGCAKLMGDLRPEFDDSAAYGGSEPPVRGGRWAERGFLEESVPAAGYRANRYGSVGHQDRGPASVRGAVASDGTASRSWVTPEAVEVNRRDVYRRLASNQAPSTENTPVYEPTPQQTYYKNGTRATRSDFIDDSQSEGSLWASNGQTNYYFSKNRVRGLGDIISITVEEDLVKDMIQEVKRSLTPADRQVELGIAQEKIRAKVYAAALAKERGDSIQSTQAAATAVPGAVIPNREPAAEQTLGVVPKEEPVVPAATMADVDINGAVEIKAGETMLGEILERYPNGNFKIRGTKRVRYKNGNPRLITLVGIVRAQDITEEDILTSGKLYEYRLEAMQ